MSDARRDTGMGGAESESARHAQDAARERQPNNAGDTREERRRRKGWRSVPARVWYDALQDALNEGRVIEVAILRGLCVSALLRQDARARAIYLAILQGEDVSDGAAGS